MTMHPNKTKNSKGERVKDEEEVSTKSPDEPITGSDHSVLVREIPRCLGPTGPRLQACICHLELGNLGQSYTLCFGFCLKWRG